MGYGEARRSFTSKRLELVIACSPDWPKIQAYDTYVAWGCVGYNSNSSQTKTL